MSRSAAPLATAPRRILGGIAALSSGEIGARLVAFAATTWLTRRLGPEGFGVVGFATAVSSYLLIAASTGLNDIGMREVARRPEAAPAIAVSAVAVRLLLALAAWLTLGLVAVVLPKPGIVRLVVFLSGLSFVSQALDTSWVYKGLERQVRVGIAGVVAQGLYATGVLLVVRAPADVLWVPVLQFAGELSGALWLGGALLRRGLPGATLGAGRAILRASGFITVSRLLRVCILSGGLVLLGLLAGERAVGLFSAAYRFCFLLIAIVTAINIAYLPSFARVASSLEQLSSLIRSSLRISAAIGAPLVVGGVVLARPLLQFMFGQAFGDAAPALQWLLVGAACVFVHGSLHNVFLVLHRTRTETAIFGLAAAVALVMSLALIPLLSATGAGVATAAAEATIAIVSVAVLRAAGLRPRLRAVAGPVAASAAMAAFLFLLPAWPLPVRVLAGGAVYVLVLAAAGALRWARSRA